MSKQTNYFLNIYHRNISVSEINQNQLQEDKSPGHFYLMLDSCGEQSFFGKSPKKSDSIKVIQSIGIK